MQDCIEPFDLNDLHQTLTSLNSQDDHNLQARKFKKGTLDLHSVWTIFRVIPIPILLDKHSNIDVLGDIDTLFAIITQMWL